ncbi:MAG: hypothetical protein KA764_20480 [Anaerolineales bacterium]|nr:hypothetical protein [Anaerolineales bacterium]
MTLPGLLLGFALATIYGAGFHLWQGGGARRLALYLLSGWLGFTLGHWVGELLGMTLMSVGTLNWLPATLGAGIALFAARWLATSETDAPRRA